MEEFINGPCLETKRVKLHSRKTSEEAYHKDLEIESYLQIPNQRYVASQAGDCHDKVRDNTRTDNGAKAS